MMQRRSPQRPERVELNIQSHPANLAATRKAIEDFAERCGFDASSRDEIGLCVNEAMANVIRHAYAGAKDRRITVVAERTADGIDISVRDWGTGVNPQCHEADAYDPLVPGGLGLVCMRQLMDALRFVPQPDGMLLIMTRHLSRPNDANRRRAV